MSYINTLKFIQTIKNSIFRCLPALIYIHNWEIQFHRQSIILAGAEFPTSGIVYLNHTTTNFNMLEQCKWKNTFQNNDVFVHPTKKIISIPAMNTEFYNIYLS